jgi:hypothetical protein
MRIRRRLPSILDAFKSTPLRVNELRQITQGADSAMRLPALCSGVPKLESPYRFIVVFFIISLSTMSRVFPHTTKLLSPKSTELRN